YWDEDLPPQGDAVNSPQPVLDLDSWYTGLVRNMARLCGAVIAGLGILVAVIVGQTEATPALVMGAVLIVLGAASWWMASRGPRSLFDRLRSEERRVGKEGRWRWGAY